MRVGIFARTFAAAGLAGALDAVAASGIRAIQFNLGLAAGATLPVAIPDALALEVRSAVRERSLEMVAVSGTYNMAHPDADVRREGLAALERLIAAAPALGTRVVTLCTGTRDGEDMWRAHAGNRAPSAWRDMLASVRSAVRAAEASDVVLAVEPEPGNVVHDAVAARRLLEEVGSANLRIVIDAANLVRAGELDRQAETLAHAFRLLGPHIALAHAKDVLDDGTVVAAGRGGLDYEHYVGLLQAAGYDGALVLHGLPAEDVTASATFLDRLVRAIAPVG